MYCILIGSGSLGTHLAEALSRAGQDVVIIDRDPEAFLGLGPDFSGFTLEGDASEREVLEQAKIGQAHVVAAITQDDNLNFLIARVAKVVYEVPTVLVRVGDPEQASLYEALGLSTICPTLLSAKRFEDVILATLSENGGAL